MKLIEIKKIRTNNFNDKFNQIKFKEINEFGVSFIKSLDFKTRLVGVYHEYDGNYKQDYSYSICYIANSENANKYDFELKIDEKMPYKIFKVNCNAKSIFNLWSNIWALEDSEDIKRTYEKDFDLIDNDEKYTVYLSVESSL